MKNKEKNVSGGASLADLQKEYKKANETFNTHFNTYNDLGVQMSKTAEELGLKDATLDSFGRNLRQKRRNCLCSLSRWGLSQMRIILIHLSLCIHRKGPGMIRIFTKTFIDAYKELNAEYPLYIGTRERYFEKAQKSEIDFKQKRIVLKNKTG
ncbi:hypothetical protein HC823_01625 [Candidatus Gracilibacteria bacterium]|nr:hypothetical protein [Candidatus Gracilibacteria bacterium]